MQGQQPQPPPGSCTHYLLHRHRFCKWPLLPGQQHCGHHTPHSRVPCPLDGSHSVAAADLAAHLRICNAARDAAEAASAAHLQPGVNDGTGADASDDDDGAAGETQAAALWRAREGDAIWPEALVAVRAVADTVLAAAHASPLPPPADAPPCVTAAVAAATAAAASQHTATPFCARHAAQQVGILAHMAAVDLLPPSEGVTYAELGAGRGYLSHMLAESYGEGGLSLLLVERRPYRNKAERQLRRAARVRCERLRCDVADLDITAAPLPALSDGDAAAVRCVRQRVVAIAKHLCGAGTDAALRCAARCAAAPGDASSPQLLGVAIAPCCHHLCRWRVFCGKTRLRAIGLGPTQFALVSRMASWALEAERSADAEHAGAHAAGDAAERWGFSAAERCAVGAAVKRLLDETRTQWATQRCGGSARLVRYCEAETSPENRLIVMRAAV